MSKLNEFLNTYGQSLRSKVTKAFSPIYDPLREENRESEWRKKLKNLLRQPFPKQTEAVLALTKGFSDISSGLYLVAEMGSGKTAISLFTSYLVCKEKSRTLIMCPGHLVEKWARELRETIPNAIIVDMNKPGLEDVMSLKDNPKPKDREFWIIGEEKPPEAPIGELFGQLGEKSIQNDGRLDELEHPVARMETTFITLTGKDGQRRMIVVEKVKRGVIRHSPGGHEAVAVIDHSNAQFRLFAGKVIYNGKQIGNFLLKLYRYTLAFL